MRQLNKYFKQYGFRYCPACNEILPFTAFSKGGNRPYADKCKECAAGRSRRWYAENRDKSLKSSARWRKNNPDGAKEITRRYYHSHREQRLEYHRQLRQSRPEYEAERHRRYSQANRTVIAEKSARRRAREAEVVKLHVSREQLDGKYAYWGNRCYICGCDDVELTLDHVKPVAAGGASMLCNYRPACISCNCSKREQWWGVTELRKLITVIGCSGTRPTTSTEPTCCRS